MAETQQRRTTESGQDTPSGVVVRQGAWRTSLDISGTDATQVIAGASFPWSLSDDEVSATVLAELRLW